MAATLPPLVGAEAARGGRGPLPPLGRSAPLSTGLRGADSKVRDFSALRSLVCNSYDSEVHRAARLGFHRRKAVPGAARLRPLGSPKRRKGAHVLLGDSAPGAPRPMAG
eukprot:CAMPEP_0198516614 /NCGR_PEP_ID=MMETSP1462-20131121/18027_1 /TAXON_ID=1333877 /ORGANISM="Brandtodinium nutriculum, Strain RCC3387" /LENGTH=108 /DNA_ID=CAMNT_0044246145 /DNA_START=21 /DNA_END=344 /DNA_ORIENTATION=+